MDEDHWEQCPTCKRLVPVKDGQYIIEPLSAPTVAWLPENKPDKESNNG